MPAIVTANIDSWARFALTGDPTSTSVTTAALNFLRPSVIAAFFAANPCTEDSEAPGETSFSGDTEEADTLAFEEAVGREVAARYVDTQAGGLLYGNSQEKVGPVSITRAQPQSPEMAKRELLTAAASARRRISCIREAIAAGNTGRDFPGFFGLAGYRRTEGRAASVQGTILGANEDGTVEL
jgi:hypothetical protein